MRVLVLFKNLEIGGAQIDGLTLAKALARAGHEVYAAGPTGPLCSDFGDVVHVDVGDRPPALARYRRLVGAIRRLHPDLIHAIGEHQIVEAHVAAVLAGGCPVSGSLMSARLPWTIPAETPVTVATPQLAAFSRRWRSNSPLLVLPPIDVDPNTEPIDGVWPEGVVKILLVSRLVRVFKEEAIRRSIEAVGAIDGCHLAIVGDGPERDHYEQIAERFAPGRVSFVGAMLDPTPAFAAADIVLGSGGSLIRGLAYGKAGIALGRDGFVARVDTASTDVLVEQGFYGAGDGAENPDPLLAMLDAIVADDALRGELGEHGAALVAERFHIDAQIDDFARFVERAAAVPPLSAWGAVRMYGRKLHYRVRKELFERDGRRLGLTDEQLMNHVGKHLRELALAPAARGTGKNLPRSAS